MNWTFPQIRFKKTESEQIEKVAEETEEFILEQDPHAKDLEALDVYHAAETLLRIRFAGREDELDAIVQQVINKNRVRDKYF